MCQYGLVHILMSKIFNIQTHVYRSIGRSAEAKLNQGSGWPRLQWGIELIRGWSCSSTLALVEGLGPSYIKSVVFSFFFTVSWPNTSQGLFYYCPRINHIRIWRSGQSPWLTSSYLRATVARYTRNGPIRHRPELFGTRLTEITPPCTGSDSVWKEGNPCVESTVMWCGIDRDMAEIRNMYYHLVLKLGLIIYE